MTYVVAVRRGKTPIVLVMSRELLGDLACTLHTCVVV